MVLRKVRYNIAFQFITIFDTLRLKKLYWENYLFKLITINNCSSENTFTENCYSTASKAYKY